MVGSNIFSTVIADFPVMYKNVYQFTCTQQTAPGDRRVQVIPELWVLSHPSET